MTPPLHLAILRQLGVSGTGTLHTDWRAFDHREWARTLYWLDLSGLALYFLCELRRSGTLCRLPDVVQANLRKRENANRLRTTAILDELGSLVTVFGESGVRYALLKGPALVPDYCPDPARRTQYDHDVLVDPACLDRADRALRSAGYQRSGDDEASVAVYRRQPERVRFPSVGDSLYSPRLPRSVEIHRALWEDAEDKVRIALPGDFLDRSVSREVGGVTFQALCDEDCLLFQILHAFRHILRNWCRISIFLEIARLMDQRAEDRAFWTRFADRLAPIRSAREASLVVLTLAGELFGTRVPRELARGVDANVSPVLRLWIDRYGLALAASNFQLDKSTLFLHSEFVDDRSEWNEIRRRRLLPVRRPHRPPPTVFQRGDSISGRVWMDSVHALGRLRFHFSGIARYLLECPKWAVLRRIRLAESGRSR